MKFLKWLLYILGGIFLIVLILALFMPSKYEIERSVTIDRPPEVVYKKVADLQEWLQWNPWSQGSDTNLFQGSMGKGHEWKWVSEEHGNGRLRIIDAEPYERLRTEIRFGDSTMTGNGEWTFEREGRSTKVTWRTWGDLGYPVGRLMGPFIDEMIGGDLKKGLKDLKKHLEEEVEMSAGPLRDQGLYSGFSSGGSMTSISRESLIDPKRS